MGEAAEKLETAPNSGNSGGMIDIPWIISRAKLILSDPKGVWSTLKAESLDVKGVYQKYLIPLALVGALCGFLGMWLIGVSAFGVTVRTPFFSGLMSAIIQCVLGLAMFVLGGFIFHTLAPKFGGSSTLENCIKLIGFSSTAALLGQFLSIIPALSILGALFGLYSLYTLFQGIPEMTGVPREKRAPFFVVSFLGMLISGIVLFTVVFAISPWSMGAASPDFNIETEDGTFDQQKFEQGLKELEKLIPNIPQSSDQ